MIEKYTRWIERNHDGPDSEYYLKREYARRSLANLEAHFLAPLQSSHEDELWKTYLDKREPAAESKTEDGTAVRAGELAATLARESLTIQRVARWRRYSPTGDWVVLREWLTDDQIREAVARLRALDMLKGKPLIIG